MRSTQSYIDHLLLYSKPGHASASRCPSNNMAFSVPRRTSCFISALAERRQSCSPHDRNALVRSHPSAQRLELASASCNRIVSPTGPAHATASAATTQRAVAHLSPHQTFVEPKRRGSSGGGGSRASGKSSEKGESGLLLSVVAPPPLRRPPAGSAWCRSLLTMSRLPASVAVVVILQPIDVIVQVVRMTIAS
jgi:hypothetical protein